MLYTLIPLTVNPQPYKSAKVPGAHSGELQCHHQRVCGGRCLALGFGALVEDEESEGWVRLIF